ncbi:MAG TPA: DUF1206 domain-containing protein [Gaiellales bacterium]|jgi:hypothetical protein|nr:DUF1206 domain-containing protein [Gaiellales bacterium]
MNANPVPRNATAFTETPIFEGLARAGYAARGVIYAMIGLLAIRLAQGTGTARPNQQGAMQKIAHQHFGHALLVLLAIGLGGYAVWRLTQAAVGHTPEYGKHSAMDRVGAVGSGIAYGAFCVLAISVLRGTAGNSSAKPRTSTAGVLHWPAGRELVAAAGVLFLLIAVYQTYLGLSKKFLKYSKTGEMSRSVLKVFTKIGVAGLVARAVAFALIGIFILKAAIDYTPRDAVGIDGALVRLTHHTYGTTALIVVAAGLIVFGAYSLADARYRKI